jgi:hypothetical protein
MYSPIENLERIGARDRQDSRGSRQYAGLRVVEQKGTGSRETGNMVVKQYQVTSQWDSQEVTSNQSVGNQTAGGHVIGR